MVTLADDSDGRMGRPLMRATLLDLLVGPNGAWKQWRAFAAAPARHRKPLGRPERASSLPGRTRASCAGAAPLTWCPPPRQGGGPVATPAAGIHRRGVPQLSPGLSPPLNLQQSSPKPTSDPPGASRSGRNLELLFTVSAEPPYEGELPAFHQIAPADFSTGPRDTGEPCTAFFAPLDRGS
ncbi:hypothetical protein NDU88_000767 [Pleurodeles waltl]|uniref:Uncharacterized protein n=1 Tax=Pleurodeles waltl TaxID=8319 RepID=A0AAV7V8G0_PLEWA|nr:hypothetical protein NDU88_000767 [Pleurodeles waltl]